MFAASTGENNLVSSCPNCIFPLPTKIETSSRPRHSAQMGNASPLSKAFKGIQITHQQECHSSQAQNAIQTACMGHQLAELKTQSTDPSQPCENSHRQPTQQALGSNGRKKEQDARGRHVREVGAPAREAHENRFNSLSESVENSYWLRGSQGISVRVRRENCQSKKTKACL